MSRPPPRPRKELEVSTLRSTSQNKRGGGTKYSPASTNESPVDEDFAAGDRAIMTKQTQERIETLQRQQKEYLTQAVRSSHTSVATGHATTQELASQGETIHRVDQNVDSIEYELKVSDKLVKNMSGFKGMIASWFMRDPKRKGEGDGCCSQSDVRSDEQHKVYFTPVTNSANPPQSDLISGTSTRRNGETTSTHDQQTDKLLDELSNNLGVMRDQAHTQQNILREQHKRLDELNLKMDKTSQHMKSTNKHIKKV